MYVYGIKRELFQPLITEELRAFNEFEEMKQRKEEIKEEVYHMSTRQLRRELLKYKYYELEEKYGIFEEVRESD